MVLRITAAALAVLLIAGCATRAKESRELIVQLERACAGSKFLLYGDMGVSDGYFIKEDQASLITDLSRQPDAPLAIAAAFKDDGRLIATSDEFVFPLLDILLRYEERTGASTQASRDDLWKRWRRTLASSDKIVLVDLTYYSDLARYEDDIRGHVAWRREQGKP